MSHYRHLWRELGKLRREIETLVAEQNAASGDKTAKAETGVTSGDQAGTACVGDGATFDATVYGTLTGHPTRTLGVLGLKRQPRDITPTLRDYLEAVREPDAD
jgi:hypothetical protein